MTERLKIVIERLYKIFEPYKSGPSMDGSPLYGELDQWNKDIFSKPLRELHEDDLSRYTGKAITTWGDAGDFKHFLPRILELTAELRTPYEIWIAFDKIHLTGWKRWDFRERKIVEEFMLALWENLIEDDSEEAEWNFQDYFSAIAHFYPNFDDLIAVWSSSISKPSIKHRVNLIINEQTALLEKKRISGFYDKSENADELIRWIFTDQMADLLQEKFYEFENEDFAEKISWAEQIITNELKTTRVKNVNLD